MCGDATDLSDVERLMEGAAADLIITDPPWVLMAAGRFLLVQDRCVLLQLLPDALNVGDKLRFLL